MRTLRSGWLVGAPLMLLAAGCGQQGGDAGAQDAESAALSYPDDAVVFRMDHTGGFVTPAVVATRLPAVSVYGDGRVITQGPTTLIFPGPALPNLQVGTISAAELENLVVQARAVGVGSASDLGTPPVADVTTTRFTVRGDKGVETLEVYALSEATADSGLTADQQAAREKLREFAESLTSDSGPLGGVTGEESRPYVPTAIAAVAEPWVAAGDVGEQPELTWPGPELPGAPLGNADLGLGCVTVTGDEASKLLSAAEQANAATPWTSAGKRWTVTLRPLLPDETDCADLT
ncbi:hypothetical protein O7627_20025 [Solwaraspora sp. WMMD1047]|uniref:hypothetical protein n=1 Tax=Solwaraspora sp. WMMD1047 TaxID=3016102 RepID=UPI0024160C0C|nr:hypothetical protein [Solwaraspora sp. WMMD1047]MDG4831571.1 hypothetical protein [Solwaraspora sp. WMMD1047]